MRAAFLICLIAVVALIASATIPNASEAYRSRLVASPAPISLRRLFVGAHPSTIFTAYATNTITAATTNDTISTVFDNGGNVTLRIVKSANGQTNRTQAMIWDAHGRLFKVSERDNTQSGSDTTLIYDALSRLLRVVEVPVASNVTNAPAAMTIDQYFDPNVAFLVLGVATNGDTIWKIMGPDLNGVYGGLNGLGGFEAIVPGPELFCPIVSDARGNLLVVNDAHHGGVLWNKSRPTGYGSVPGYRPPALGHGASLVECSAWGGKWPISGGFYIIGLRALEADAGQWTSADAAGHGASDNLMSYAGGDPINLTDVNGLCNRQTLAQYEAIDSFYDVRRTARYGAEIDAAADSYVDAAANAGHRQAYQAAQFQQAQATADTLTPGLSWGQQWKYNRTAIFDNALATAANVATLGIGNSVSITAFGTDFWGNNNYSTGDRLFEGAMLGAMVVPGLGWGTRAEASFGGGMASLAKGEMSLAAEGLPDAYAGIRQASQYLQDMGVARADRVRILQSFEAENMSVRQAGQSEFGLRYFSDANRAGGSYLFETFPASRESLAIKPEWSTMSGFRQFQIEPGTTILQGRAAAQGPYLPGGQVQKFILDWRNGLIPPR